MCTPWGFGVWAGGVPAIAQQWGQVHVGVWGLGRWGAGHCPVSASFMQVYSSPQPLPCKAAPKGTMIVPTTPLPMHVPGTEFQSVIKGKVRWTGAWVQAVARGFVDDLPAPARNVLQDPRWLGGPLATLIHPPTICRQDIDRNEYLISKVLQAIPSKIPSGFLIADILLAADDILCNRMLPQAHRCTFALEQGGLVKRMIQYVRNLWRRHRTIKAGAISRLKALVKESMSPRGRFGDMPEDGEFDWETPVPPEPDGTDAAVQAIADTPLQETITASLKVVRERKRATMKRKRAVASFRRAKRRAVLAVTGTAAGVALAATDADGGAAAGGASAATDAAGGAAGDAGAVEPAAPPPRSRATLIGSPLPPTPLKFRRSPSIVIDVHCLFIDFRARVSEGVKSFPPFEPATGSQRTHADAPQRVSHARDGRILQRSSLGVIPALTSFATAQELNVALANAGLPQAAWPTSKSMGQWSYTVVSEQGHACEVLWRSRAFRMKRMQGGKAAHRGHPAECGLGDEPSQGLGLRRADHRLAMTAGGGLAGACMMGDGGALQEHGAACTCLAPADGAPCACPSLHHGERWGPAGRRRHDASKNIRRRNDSNAFLWCRQTAVKYP